MHKIMDYFCDQLDEMENKVSREGKLSRTEVEDIKLMSKAWNELHDMEMAKEEEYSNAMGGYSRRGNYSRRMSYADGGSYGDSSYTGDGSRDFVRPDGSYRYETPEASYARGRGRNARRDSMGRYSRAEDELQEGLMKLMDKAPDEQTRSEIRRLMEKM